MHLAAGAIIDFLGHCQHSNGGFGGGPGQLAHLAPTYAAVGTLVTLGGEQALASVNRQAVASFIQQMAVRPEDGGLGGFTVCEGAPFLETRPLSGKGKEGQRGCHRPAWAAREGWQLGCCVHCPHSSGQPYDHNNGSATVSMLSILFPGPHLGHGSSTVLAAMLSKVESTGAASISAESAQCLQAARWMCGAATVPWLQRTCWGWTKRPWQPGLAWCSTCKPAR